MNGEVQKLVALDKVQQEIMRLKGEIAGLPKIMAAIEAKLAAAKSRVAEAQATIKKEEAARRGFESDIQDRNNKIIKLREQSSSVKTNEQYRAMLSEIAFAENEITQFEEKILLSMEQQDELKKRLKAAEDELKADTAEIEKEKEHARTVTAADEKRLAELNEERSKLRTGIDDSTLQMFERVAAKRSPAIAEAIEQKCSACNVMMRPQTFNELKAGDRIIFCESCARVLYHDPAHDRAPEAGIRPSERGKRAWFYYPDWKGRSAFVELSNSKERSSMRVFDAQSGEPIEKAHKKNVGFREAFAEQISRGVPLEIQQHGDEEDVESLAPEMLEELQAQAGTTAQTQQ